jgi:hypothetical protein
MKEKEDHSKVALITRWQRSHKNEMELFSQQIALEPLEQILPVWHI